MYLYRPPSLTATPDLKKMETCAFFILHVRLIWLPMSAMSFSWRPKLSIKGWRACFTADQQRIKELISKIRELSVIPVIPITVVRNLRESPVISHRFRVIRCSLFNLGIFGGPSVIFVDLILPWRIPWRDITLNLYIYAKEVNYEDKSNLFRTNSSKKITKVTNFL